MTPSASERAALASELLRRGPDAPTLCEGWRARDLAAHLVVRERRPDAALGVVLAPMAAHGERVRAAVAARPFAELVAAVADGPPRLSPFSLPGVDGAVNTGEHFVHLEDLRRAGEHPQEPRELAEDVRRALWSGLRGRATLLYRKAPVGVVLETPEGRAVVRRAPGGAGEVVIRGDVGEVLLHSFGREAVARVELDGAPEHVRALAGVSRAV
ncbi:TIGR03085 family metal-binding protein [uncultured Pseudokineococcus sp.]|uniref:TIGR03085 family metal-binding protein n=1 Tax=uncultured Pseudokineococcus sp. TaxID=1642928 RepID=UPI002603D413|nr:TIGR03085 family metal-binding protein [uncultured Pseudokineococcus sp.]